MTDVIIEVLPNFHDLRWELVINAQVFVCLTLSLVTGITYSIQVNK